MSTLTSKQFSQKLDKLPQETRIFIEKKLPVIAGKLAVDHFKEGFQDEGFTDKELEKWDEVKRREDRTTRGARSTRKILTGDTGDLGESIEYETGTGKTIVESDKDYSEAHNEGTTNAGRNRNVTIPKRQFIGESEKLNIQIETEIELRGKDLIE